MVEVQERPELLHGATYKTITGCGAVYVTINEFNDQTFEIFINHGKNGRCASVMMGALGVTISHGLRAGVKPEEYMKALTGFRCDMAINSVNNKGTPILSCVDAVAKVFSKYLNRKDPSNLKENVEIDKMEATKDFSYTAIAPAPSMDSTSELQEIANKLTGPPKIKVESITVTASVEPNIIGGSVCEVCGSPVIMQEGCEKCLRCGHSQKCGG
jgi:ribonucleoside-diphosphate reductase alpha chain